MKVGIGLPSHIAGVLGPLNTTWARHAEQRGFECVAVIDRLVYPSLDALVALALAAGATESIGLVTNILLAPLYPAAVLAKQLATIADAAPNRLTLGIAVGAREDDYTTADADFGTRGRALDRAMEVMRTTWRGVTGTEDALCPAPVTIPVVFGGGSAATLRRATTLGDGWAAGALRDYPGQSKFAERVRRAWPEAGRVGTPLLHASVNYAFGDDATVGRGRGHLARYYGFNPDYAKLNTADMITAPHDAWDTVNAYRDLGFDRLIFHPCVAALEQVDRLADAVL
jgi:alkanesulfonate monooxygenase SsuD/methylene tetrahydromethanopterin reductase-like flavin-dependent oxidoreductase (luciferase family)